MNAIEQLAYDEARRYPKQTAAILDSSAAMQIVCAKVEVLRTIKAKGYSRDALKELHVKQVSRTEEEVAERLEDYFKESVKRIASVGSFTPDPARAEQQAEKLVEQSFDAEKETAELFKAATPVLAEAILRGIVSELTLNREAVKTTAQEFAERYGISELDGFAIGEMPQWMLDAANDALEEIFAQDYWLKIPETTRDDIQHTLQEAIKDGLSIREIANRIVETRGEEYTRWRATTVARTESSAMLNAGHEAGIKQLNEELDFELGKEFLSVLGTTTRDTHAAADGQVVGADENFTIGGYEAPYPAHHSLPAAERCNCQCTLTSSIVGESFDGAEAREEIDQGEAAEMAM